MDFGTIDLAYWVLLFMLASGIIAGRKDLIEKIDAMRRTMGTSLDPNSAFLTENGMLNDIKNTMNSYNTGYAIRETEILEGYDE